MSIARFFPETMAELAELTTFHTAVVYRNDAPGGDNKAKVMIPDMLGPDGVSNWMPCMGSNVGPETAGRKQTGFHNPPKLGGRGFVCFPGLDCQQPLFFPGDIIRNTPGDPGDDNDPSGSYGS